MNPPKADALDSLVSVYAGAVKRSAFLAACFSNYGLLSVKLTPHLGNPVPNFFDTKFERLCSRMIGSDAIRKGMKLTLFRSTKEPDVFGFTADPTGSNLPDEFGPWRKAGEGTAAHAYAGDSLDSGIASSDPVMKAVERDGFYLARSGVTGTHSQESGMTS
jgi:hypothetical protein